MEIKGGNVPLLHVEAESIPEAHYKAVKAVWENGATKRTQYDRKDSSGNYIDPPGKDAQCIIRVNNPFSQPRYAPLSFCERGKYILEILGAKNHNVIPRDEILSGVDEHNLGTKWPYSYNQRLIASPIANGTINQIENVLGRLEKDLNSRRCVMTTRVPEIDTRLSEDLPCLGEVHFRCFEDEDGKYALNMTTMWRSRDLFKAWPDNVIGLTYLGRKIAEELGERTSKNIRLGAYTDFSNSLHIYGQDFAQVGGDKKAERKGFFEGFPSVEDYIARSMNSEDAREVEVLPQMKDLLNEQEVWNFTPSEKNIIRGEIISLEKGLLP